MASPQLRINGLTKSFAGVPAVIEASLSIQPGEVLALLGENGAGKSRRVSATGVATIFITHRLDEIERVCTSAAVMRNGRVVLRTGEVAGKRDELVHAMIGRDPKQHETKRKPTPGKTILHVSGLIVRNQGRIAKPVVENLSLEVRAGEIVGLFGLVGAGRTEFAKAIFGAWRGEVEGSVTINGKAGRPESPHEAIGRRVAMLTEDRKRSGIIEGQSAFHNISAASISRVTRLSVIDRKKERDRNVSLARKLDVRPFRLDAAIETFSGGNQQKIMLARWMATDPDLLIVDEPTYGVDVGARFEIYQLLRELADAGKAILLISSDLEEIVNETDRVVVMYKGRIGGEFPRGSSRHQLMAAATGDLKQTPSPNAA